MQEIKTLVTIVSAFFLFLCVFIKSVGLTLVANLSVSLKLLQAFTRLAVPEAEWWPRIKNQH